MRYFYCLLFFISVLANNSVFAQCAGGTNGGGITIFTTWQTTGTTSINGGTYRTFNATAGNIYYFSFCTGDGGSSIYDTQISINTSAGVVVAGGYNDDFCGSQSYLAWTCPATATYRVLVNLYNCGNQNNLGNLAYKYSPALSCPGNLGLGVTNVSSLPYASGAGTTCGFGNDLSSNNVTSCGSGSYFGGEDRIWIFTPAVTGTVTINLTSAGTWNGLMLYQGCPLIGQGGTCISVSQSATGNQSIVACLSAGVTYYLVLDVFPSPNCNAYSNLTISAPVTAGGCPLGTGAVNIPSLPYSSVGRTTCGKFNDQSINNTISCGSSNYLTGEDEVFVFTAAASGNISVNLTSTGSYTGLMLYNGCPLSTTCSGIGGTCVAFEQSSTGNKTMCANVVAGQIYYLIVDSWAAPACNPYSISISAPAALLTGSVCANAVPIPALPFSAVNETTSCTGNDYSNSTLGSCGSYYESGEDKVYVYTATQSECVEITITGASSNSIGYQLYRGCPGVAGTTCMMVNGGANSGLLSSSFVIPSAGTYYLVVDSWAPPTTVSYNLTITSFGSGVANDLPCNATSLLLGVPMSSSNTCSGASGEPTPPSCFVTPNVMNSVWFSVQAPATGQIRARVIPNTIINPQMALYSGSCGSSMTLVSCNDNAPSCGQSINYSSEIFVTGLIPGSTYFILVDGYSDLTGSFSILAIDGATALPPLSNGQDCGYYLPVCDSSISYGDPGFQAFGNICDYTGGILNCLLSGERGSAWFDIPINANGNLSFSIIPKDWPGAPSTASTDYDFAIWKIVGTGAVTCAQIATNVAPLRCNYQILGVTGLYGLVNNTAPPQYPGFGPAFNTQLPVLNGERYALVVSNFSNSTSGFDIVFSSSSPINYAASGNASVWSGGVDTDWFKVDNWGGCPIPSCTRDAIINGGIILQPVLTGAANSKSLLINPGARLTIPAGITLNICENFTNLGLMNADPTSTILFWNGLNQNIGGNFLGGNAFGNFTVSKTGGLVTQLQPIDIKSIFTLGNPTSIYSVNGKVQKVAGNFLNYGVYNPVGGTLELNGTNAQAYRNYDIVNNVVLNHTGPGVNLNTSMILGSTGFLTLTNGRIITSASYEVIVNNRTPAAVSTGNPSSFVQGFLRRYLNSTGSYDFPVGDALKGFQRANINFAYPANPTVIDNLRVNFTPYASLPTPLGVIDCSLTFTSNALDNGRWVFSPSNSPTSGNFDLTLYNTGFTNAANSWTIMSNSGGPWTLANGTCVLSPVTAVRRNAMNGLYEFGTAQGPSTLPVSWLNFFARPNNRKIILDWSTASEDNNLGFEIERQSENENVFSKIGWVDGGLNSSVVLNYSFEDENVEPEIDYFYRLKQVDLNGLFDYSEIVHARLNVEGSNKTQIVPNPITNNSILIFELKTESKIEISVFNSMGELVCIKEFAHLISGIQKIDIDLICNKLNVGFYTFRIAGTHHLSYCKALIVNKI
ncbi:MAG: hypothetical protein ACKVQV_03110 [Bacteroidia bacterium]